MCLDFFDARDILINRLSRARSSTDRVLVFGTSDGGSIPSGRIVKKLNKNIYGSSRCTKYKYAPLAQPVEQSPLKRVVAGSIPARGIFLSTKFLAGKKRMRYNMGERN